jgi:hypothetical protein
VISIAGRAGLAATAVSIACTVTVAISGPSLMEPPLPGAADGPPWALDLGLNPYLAVGLAAAGLITGTVGVALTLRAMRRGWTVSPLYVLLAGALAAVVAGTTRPFGTSDFLSYAAYGRELVTGHNPYLVTPEALARLGDPVARAVQDWAGTPSVYGALATGVFGVASVIGATSVRLTVFVLAMVNVSAFIGTGVLLDRMARDRPARLRAAVLWTCNPLLLQILVAGSHVDGLAAAFSIAGIALLARFIPNGPVITSLLAGMLLGLGFAVKPTVLLVAVGVVIAMYTWHDSPAPASERPASASSAPSASPLPRAGTARDLIAFPRVIARQIAIKWVAITGLAAGFGLVAGADILLIGRAGIAQTLRASGMVSVGSPWRPVRAGLSLFVAEPVADEAVRWSAVALAALLAMRLLRLFRPAGEPADFVPVFCRYSGGNRGQSAGWVAFALVLAWLMAWPYVLPWYDALAWALLPLLPASGFDWLLLARTAVLGLGYLPARSAGITIPGGLSWMEPVLRTAVTPAVLALLLVILIRWSSPVTAERYGMMKLCAMPISVRKGHLPRQRWRAWSARSDLRMPRQCRTPRSALP